MTEPISAGPGGSFLDRLGPRVLRRAEPRASIAVAGAGCALAVLGALIISGDTGATDDAFNRWPGVVLSAAVVVAGFVALSQVASGAIATGGTVAAALGVPPLMFFLTWDEGGTPPFSSEAILVVSAAVWLAAYLWGPGRGRPFFLGAGLIALWASILEVVEGVFDAPWVFFGSWFGYSSATTFEEVPTDTPFGNGATFDAPDPTTLGILSLVLGCAYLLATQRLDRGGRHGAATPFAAATVPVLVTVPFLLAEDLETAGSGLLVTALGAALALVGTSVHRRGLTWLGGAGVAIGVAIFLGDMTDDATVGGMLYLAAGIGLVFVGHAWATARAEPDEMAVTAPWFAAPPVAAASAPSANPAGPATGAGGPHTAPSFDPADASTATDTASPGDDDHSQWAPPSDDTDGQPPPPPPPPS